MQSSTQKLTADQQFQLAALKAFVKKWKSTATFDNEKRASLLAVFKNFWAAEFRKLGASRHPADSSEKESLPLGRAFFDAIDDIVVSLALADGMKIPKFDPDYEYVSDLSLHDPLTNRALFHFLGARTK